LDAVPGKAVTSATFGTLGLVLFGVAWAVSVGRSVLRGDWTTGLLALLGAPMVVIGAFLVVGSVAECFVVSGLGQCFIELFAIGGRCWSWAPAGLARA